MLFARWNKNGSKVMCEQSQIAEIEKNGYDLKECPDVEPLAIAKVEPEVNEQEVKEVEQEEKKPVRRTRKKKEEEDIVLD